MILCHLNKLRISDNYTKYIYLSQHKPEYENIVFFVIVARYLQYLLIFVYIKPIFSLLNKIILDNGAAPLLQLINCLHTIHNLHLLFCIIKLDWKNWLWYHRPCIDRRTSYDTNLLKYLNNLLYSYSCHSLTVYSISIK